MKKIFLVLSILLIAVTSNAYQISIGSHDFDYFDVSSVDLMGEPTFAAGQDLGYYIWTEDESRRTWNVVWSADGGTTKAADGSAALYKFTGNIFITPENELDILSPLLAWEYTGTYADSVSTDFDKVIIDYQAYANTSYDGFRFTIMGDFTPSYLGFDLNISGLNVSSPSGVYSFLGTNNISPESNDFAVAAPVPEPATLLLLGSGLAGLAFLRRRKS